jgi:pimeloyl-ACP methyl ester carboxylesterase
LSAVTDFQVDSAGARISGEEAGEGPPVALLHGLTATRRYVVMGSRMLERGGHRVIAYDARGHGRSGPAPSPSAYTYADLADDLGAVLDVLGVSRAVLAGASMGAHTLIRFALDHPERAAGLVIATPAYDPADSDDPSRLERWDKLAEGLRSGGAEGFVAAYGEPRVPERFRDTVVKVLHQRLSAHEHPDALADALQAVPRSRPFDAWSDLRPLGDLPVVVVADRDEADPEHPLATGERYAAEIPGAELRVEDPGASPLAWQGGQLSKIIGEVVARANGRH